MANKVKTNTKNKSKAVNKEEKKVVKKSDKQEPEKIIISSESDIYNFDDLIDQEEKKMKVNSIAVTSKLNPGDVMSTDILCNDLILGGGYKKGGVYEISGPEHSGKTASLYHGFSSCLRFIPNKVKGMFLDNEGQVDPPWWNNISNISVEDTFGVRDEETGEWLIKPKIRYYKPNTGEAGLKLIKRVLERMPDKVLLGKTWYYIFSPKPPKKVDKTGGYSVTDLKNMLSDRYSKKLFDKTGNFYVPVPNNYGGVEFVIGNDSWATMVPEAVAEDDSSAMGGPARMFAKHCNDIKSKCGNKGVILLGINQIREKPMAFGNPIYFPGGNTLKHMTDARLYYTTSGKPEEEDSDKYKNFKVQTIKNKIFIPFKEAVNRWWFEHDGKSGFGCDPVADTLNFFKMTNQFKGTNKGFYVKFEGTKRKKLNDLSKTKFSYDSFKEAILDPKSFGLDIRQCCFEQIQVGIAVPMFLRGDIRTVDEDSSKVEKDA